MSESRDQTNITSSENVKFRRKNQLHMASAIIFASVLLAGAIFYMGREVRNYQKNLAPALPSQSLGSKKVENVKPVTNTDHIRGNPSAPVKIIEFSDTECPFCKNFHFVLKQLINEEGNNGRVAWVYRHFPLRKIHPKALKEAEALECAGEIGGENKFWEYADKIFEITPSNNMLDPVELLKTAVSLGIDKNRFEECLSSGKYSPKVESDVADAVMSGGSGTPYNVIIGPNGQKIGINGTQTYEVFRQFIDFLAPK